MHSVTDLRDLLTHELDQRAESGHAVDDLRPRVAEAIAGGADDPELEALLEQVEAAPRRADWAFDEPDDEETLAALAAEAADRVSPWEGADDALVDRMLGAWSGRCVGCLLGKPFEGLDRAEIARYLAAAGVDRLDDYVPLLDPLPDGLRLHPSWTESVRGRIDGAARDDDTDYTILGLHLLETHGRQVTRADVASAWLARFPFLQIFTAERAAYRNLVAGLGPDRAAGYRNPYREWIGAQIRADAWGYAAPGDLRTATRLAYQDASLSHAKNGIFGELWAAALVAASFTAADAEEALEAATALIPPRSRLAVALGEVAEAHAAGRSWSTWRDELDSRPWGAYSWVHTVNNACLVAAALRWGGGDFEESVSLAVRGGWDTDCNGASVGSVIGALHGARAVGRHWLEPLHDEVRSAIFGFERCAISDLAARTVRIARSAG